MKTAALYLAYLLAVLAGVDYLAYRRFVGRIKGHDRPSSWSAQRARSGVPDEVLNAVGSLSPPRAGTFQGIAPQPKPGVVRVAAFGDSFTYGDEVAAGYDYPSQLQRLFRERGYPNVEVVNFGSSWHGFAQTYFLWQWFARRYHADFVLLGPATFYPERFCTFNHAGALSPYYIHGRYVLEDGKPAFLEPLGGPDFQARFDEYFRFIPRWRYLRYDRNPPAFLRCLLPDGLDLPNPFYYLRGRAFATEVDLLTRALLSRLIAGSRQTILLNSPQWPGFLSWAGQLKGPLVFGESPANLRFPYVRYLHYGAMGNRLVAEGYFDALTGRDSMTIRELKFGPAPAGSRPTGTPSLEPFSRADVVIGQTPLASLLRLDRPGVDLFADPHQQGIQALFTLSSAQDVPMDALYAPLDFRPEAGMPVTLELAGRGRSWSLELGRASTLVDGLIGYRPSDAFDGGWNGRPCLTLNQQWLARLKIDPRLVRSGSVSLAGRVIYRVIRQGSMLLATPEGGPQVRFEALAKTFLDVDRLPSRGLASLRLSGPGRRLTLPLASWEKVERRIPLRANGPRYRVTRSEAAPVALRGPVLPAKFKGE